MQIEIALIYCIEKFVNELLVLVYRLVEKVSAHYENLMSFDEIPASMATGGVSSAEAVAAVLRAAPSNSWPSKRAFCCAVKRIAHDQSLQSLGKDGKFQLLVLLALRYAFTHLDFSFGEQFAF